MTLKVGVIFLRERSWWRQMKTGRERRRRIGEGLNVRVGNLERVVKVSKLGILEDVFD